MWGETKAALCCADCNALESPAVPLLRAFDLYSGCFGTHLHKRFDHTYATDFSIIFSVCPFQICPSIRPDTRAHPLLS